MVHLQDQFANIMDTNLSYALTQIQIRLQQNTLAPKDPIFTRVYSSIKDCILKGDFPLNWNIPSTRQLSGGLQLARTTIIKAYELLMLEKLIISKPGSGYKVIFNQVQSPPPKPTTSISYPTLSEKGVSFLENSNLINRTENSYIAFKPGLPPIDIFPIKQWKGLLNTYWKYAKSSDMSIVQSTHSLSLKNQICNFLKISRGISCTPEQLLVVSGSLQSIYLIANAILNKGDSVVIENPTFPNVHSLFKSSLANVVPIPIYAEGLYLKILETTQPENLKILHVTPTNHYPLGTKMGLKRRHELLHFASKNNTYIIENDYEHEIGNLTAPLPTLFELDTEDRTIYLGTFNRLLYPSIRLGFMIVPHHLAAVIEAIQAHSHRIVSHSMQIVMAQFIEKNHLFKHLKNLQNVTQERFEVFTNEFNEQNEHLYLKSANIAGMHLIAKFKQEVSIPQESKIIHELESSGISAYPLSSCFIGVTKETGLILVFATMSPVAIKQKLRLLKKVMVAIFNSSK